MIWVTWRQQRLEALLGGALLALIAMFLLKTGLDIAAAFQSSGLAGCLARNGRAPQVAQLCALNAQTFQPQVIHLEYPVYQGLIFAPLVIGLLLGAPFALELEHGSYRLAWTQSVTRLRWASVKVVLIVVGAALAGAALAALATWWWIPLTQLDNRLNRNPFELIGIVPVAYTVFAAALCLATGTLLRRAIPAVGLTLAGFLALRLWIETQVRYNFLPPLIKKVPLNAAAGLAPGDYIVDSNATISPSILNACTTANPKAPPDAPVVQACLARHGVVQVITYQTADRFWPFQLIESAIFLGLSAGLIGLTVWWVRRRIT